MEAFAPGTIEAFGLYLVRTSALVLAAPVFGSNTGFSGYKVTLIFAVALLLYGVHGVPLDHSLQPIEFACLALREVLIGLALSFSLQLVVLVVRVAGDVIGTEMGFNMASIIDPVMGVQTPIITQIYETFFFLGFLMVNGHHMLMRGLAQSFERAPVGTLEVSKELPWIIERLFSQMFTAGLTFAAPVMVLLVTATLILALLSRAVPQLNVNEVGYALRVIIGLAALFAFSPFLASALEGLYAHIEIGMTAVIDAVGT